MEGWISPLEGYFDGYQYVDGPLSIRIENGSIIEIVHHSVDDPSLSGRGKILSPPFVDGHTHSIFAGTRFNELTMKLAGKSYNDILQQGGGIQATVRATREASSDQLKHLLTERLNTMVAYGTLDVEIKSGYGLNTEQEIRLLEIIQEVQETHLVNIHPTFGAAHVIPPEISADTYIDQIIDEMLPVVKNKSLATSTDVFCDKGAFSIEQTRSIFDASERMGIPVRVHAEELEYSGIAQIASSNYNLRSADHLLHAKQEDFVTLAQNETVAMFMPLAPFGLFVDTLPSGFHNTGVTIGLGSDFNPNNWALSMQSAIRMAVFRYRMPPLKALQAAISGSFQGITGQQFLPLQEDSPATFILLAARSISELVSKFGLNSVTHVFHQGELLHKNIG